MKEELFQPHEWFELRGRKILSEQMIRSLDNGDVEVLYQTRSESALRTYRKMICPLQDAIHDFMYGATEIDVSEADFFERSGQKFPKNRAMPDCFEQLFKNIEDKLGRDLSIILDRAEKSSVQLMEERELNTKRHESKCAYVRSLLWNVCGFAGDIAEDSELQVMNKLGLVQKRKLDDEAYVFENSEVQAYEIWMSMLSRKISNPRLSYAQMKELVSNDFMSESEFSKLLEKHGDDRDYEWYEEGFAGSDFLDSTLFTYEEILPIVTPRFKHVLGFS